MCPMVIDPSVFLLSLVSSISFPPSEHITLLILWDHQRRAHQFQEDRTYVIFHQVLQLCPEFIPSLLLENPSIHSHLLVPHRLTVIDPIKANMEISIKAFMAFY